MEKELNDISSMEKTLDILKDIKWVEAEMYLADLNAYLTMRKEKLLNTIMLKDLPQLPKPEAKLPERTEEMTDEQFDALMKTYDEHVKFYEEYNRIIDGIVDSISEFTFDEATSFVNSMNSAIQKTKAKLIGDKTVGELDIKLPSRDLIKSKYAQEL